MSKTTIANTEGSKAEFQSSAQVSETKQSVEKAQPQPTLNQHRSTPLDRRWDVC
jgi:hypothetical protein